MNPEVSVKSYEDLIVWQKGKVLAVEIYRISKLFPKEELYGMTSQLRRSSVSIPSNIAEGHGRSSTAEFVRFLEIARGSLYETLTQLDICREVGLLADSQYSPLREQAKEIEKMLNSLLSKLRLKI